MLSQHPFYQPDLFRHPLDTPIPYAYDAYIHDKNTQYNSHDNSVRAMICSVSSTASSYLITAGCDKMIRYWDFSSTGKCCTIWGLESHAQPKPTFEAPLIMNTYDNNNNRRCAKENRNFLPARPLLTRN
jgi:WD40 repeat protein